MTKPKKKPALLIKASDWLKDEQRFTILENTDLTSRVAARLLIVGGGGTS